MKITKRPKKVKVLYIKNESYHTEYTCPSCYVTFVGAGLQKNVLSFVCDCGQVLKVDKNVFN